MIEPWKPRGPQDRKWSGAALLVLATEEHRDAMLVTMFMLPNPPFYDHRRVLLAAFQTVNLRGGYGIIAKIMEPGQTAYATETFRHMLLPWARTFHTEHGRPYAWRITKNYLGSPNIEAGRSPDNRGQNLKEVLKRSFPDLLDGTYKEKGVTYEHC